MSSLKTVLQTSMLPMTFYTAVT